MDPKDLEELEQRLQEVSGLLGAAFEGLTGEQLALDSVVRRYPVVVLSLAVGVGVTIGLWFGRRSAPALPPPPATQNVPLNPLEYLEQLLPHGLEKARDLVPEEASGLAGHLIDTVIEPRLRQGLDALSANTADGRFGEMLRERLRRRQSNEDHELPDPEE